MNKTCSKGELTVVGTCECGGPLTPIFSTELEYTTNNVPTGRKRRACSHLVCTECLRNFCVDGDYLVGNWYR